MRLAISQALSEKNINAREFAKEIGISQSFMSQIINGQRNPRLEIAFKIAEYLEKPLEELFGENYQSNIAAEG